MWLPHQKMPKTSAILFDILAGFFQALAPLYAQLMQQGAQLAIRQASQTGLGGGGGRPKRD